MVIDDPCHLCDGGDGVELMNVKMMDSAPLMYEAKLMMMVMRMME